MAKLPFHVLVEKIQTGKISEKELVRYFVIEQNPTQPFDYLAGVNTNTVDVTNVERSAPFADQLLRDAGTVLEHQAAHRRRKKVGAKYRRKSPIVAEGDSWFKLPDLHPVVPWTLINFLQQRYSIINLAHWGDTLADMILTGEFWPYLMSGQSDVFLFSGGGNDVLGGGELWRFVNLFDVDHSQPSDAAYYVRREFYDNLDIIANNYEALIRQIEIRTPSVIMVGHGYDYVIPRDGGPWLGGPLARQGHYMIDRPKLCQAIVDIMIDAFNNKLKVLQTRHPKAFRYVDLRGTVKPGEWWDELHPKDAGARKTAGKFSTVIESLPASGTLSPPIAAARSRLLRAA